MRTGRMHLSVALEKIQGLLRARCVVSKGGGGINGALLRAGLVDELQMLWYPPVIGGAGTPHHSTATRSHRDRRLAR